MNARTQAGEKAKLMSAETVSSAEAVPVAAVPRPAARARAVSCALVGLLGFALPVMRHVDFAGGEVNACAADLLLLPALFALRGRWVRSGGLGGWLLVLWLINLVSWAASISLLTFSVFLRESAKVATCYLYALVGFGIGRDVRTENALIKGLVFAAIPMAAVGIFAFFARVPRSFIVDARVAGTLGDANAFGIYLGMVLPLTASVRAAWLAIPLFIGAGVVSFSRTGLTAIASSLLLSTLNLSLRKYLLVLLVCALVFLGVWRAASQTTVGKRISNYHGSLEERHGLWAMAADMAARHPLFGIGKGNWGAASGRRTLPHNTFLSIMVDGGLVGFAAFLVPLVVWLWRGVRQSTARRWAIAVMIGLVGGLAVSLDNFRLFWVSVGVLVAQLMVSSPASPGSGSAEPASRRPDILSRSGAYGNRRMTSK